MSTQFNLVGWFARHTRESIGGKIHEHREEAVTLIPGISVSLAAMPTSTPVYWEQQADLQAVKHAKYTPFEKKWLVRWELVPIECHEEKAA